MNMGTGCSWVIFRFMSNDDAYAWLGEKGLMIGLEISIS